MPSDKHIGIFKDSEFLTRGRINPFLPGKTHFKKYHAESIDKSLTQSYSKTSGQYESVNKVTQKHSSCELAPISTVFPLNIARFTDLPPRSLSSYVRGVVFSTLICGISFLPEIIFIYSILFVFPSSAILSVEIEKKKNSN